MYTDDATLIDVIAEIRQCGVEPEFYKGFRHHIVRYASHFFNRAVQHIHAAFKCLVDFLVS